jgi:hypothetical protein
MNSAELVSDLAQTHRFRQFAMKAQIKLSGSSVESVGGVGLG